MITLEAPFSLPQALIRLPNPEFSDLIHNQVGLNYKKTMTGEKYTYVKRKGRQKQVFKIILTRNKAFEFENFIEAFIASEIKLTNHNGEIWRGRLVNDPFETAGKFPGEMNEINIEFEGVQVNG